MSTESEPTAHTYDTAAEVTPATLTSDVTLMTDILNVPTTYLFGYSAERELRRNDHHGLLHQKCAGLQLLRSGGEHEVG